MLKRVDIAREVIAGYWGSGDKRVTALRNAGYNPDVVQGDVNTLLCCRENIINNMKAFAVKIADDPRYWYIYYGEKYGKECAVCHPHGGANHGWQCIGFAMAVWHHGGLPIPCNCGVIDNSTWEKILNAKTDAEALKLAKNCLKISDIKVIRNKNVIPKSQAQAGDMAAYYVSGNKYQHTYFIMSSSKVADATTASPKANNIRADRSFSGKYVNNMKVLIRYTGNGLCSAPKRTIDELAYEVIDGLWGSGESRVRALTEAGHDYNAVQKRVNEILNPEKHGYDGIFPDLHLVKTNAQVIADTIQFAKWIAGDNDFHYGHGEAAHKCGCYFCKTQPASKKNAGIKMYEHAQCCNPFVNSCFAHGGCVLDWLKVDLRGGSYDWNSMPGLKDFKKVSGTPKAGDIVCKTGHMALSLGGTKVIQASGGDDNVIHSNKWNKSISEGTWSGFTDVYRYVGSVDVIMPLRHGEVSDRVGDMQRFLNWYGNYGLNPDREFGDKTLAAFKDFQSKEGLVADGVCGIDSITKMKEVRK